jgi:hypothetical protein
LFAAEDDRGNPCGLAAELRLWRVPGGCGCFYPDPLSNGYLRIEPSFQQALGNAWRAESSGTRDIPFSL